MNVKHVLVHVFYRIQNELMVFYVIHDVKRYETPR